jgi:hypothetical protein
MSEKKTSQTKKARHAMTTGTIRDTVSTPGNAADLVGSDEFNPPHPADVRAALVQKAEENEKINDDAYMERVAENKAYYNRAQGIVDAESDVSVAAQGGKHGGKTGQGAPNEL